MSFAWSRPPALRSRRGKKSATATRSQYYSFWKSFQAMTNSEQDRWSRVKGRLRSTVGEDVYTSWFARMDLEGVQQEKRSSVGSNPVPQELDSGPLCRARAVVLAGGDAGGTPDRSHRAHGMRCATPVKEAPARLKPGAWSVPRPNCARPRPCRCPPAMMRLAARRSIPA